MRWLDECLLFVYSCNVFSQLLFDRVMLPARGRRIHGARTRVLVKLPRFWGLSINQGRSHAAQ